MSLPGKLLTPEQRREAIKRRDEGEERSPIRLSTGNLANVGGRDCWIAPP
jgi:hypothetical protein